MGKGRLHCHLQLEMHSKTILKHLSLDQMCGHQEPGLVCLGDLSPSCWPHWTVWPSDPPRTTLTWRQWSGISEFVFHKVAKIDFFILFFFFKADGRGSVSRALL